MASEQAVTAATGEGGAPAEPVGGVLANRDFAKLFAGELVSLIGTQITLFALPLVAILTLRATVLQVGVLNALRLAPVIVVALFAGVWLDRSRRRPVLIACSLSCVVFIGLVPVASATGFLSLPLLYVVAVLVGGLNVVFDIGALSYVPNLVEPRQLPEANSKIAASRAVAGISGPAIAGLLVGLLTAPITMSADAISYLFSAAGLLSITRQEPAPEVPGTRVPVRRQIAEGFRAVYGGKVLRSLLAQTTVLNLGFGAMWTIFLVYAIRSLHLSPFKLGIVAGAAAIGGLAGALSTTRIRNALGFGRSMILATAGSSLAPLLFIIPRGAGLVSLTILVVAQIGYGASLQVLNVNSITLRQVVTPKRVLARMNATYRMLLFSATPAGALIAGLLGSAIGLRPMLVIAVIVMATPSLWIFFSPVFRLREMPSGPAEDLPAAAGTKTGEARQGAGNGHD
jgi:MFS family permease